MSSPRFGVNYTPTRGWFHHWLDFDLDEVRADLDSLAGLGLDHIRVFPLWPLFQPNRALVRPRAVEQLLALADAAGERGLDVNVDGLQGHLSSFDFLPAWTRTWHRRNLFTDPDAITREQAGAWLERMLAACEEGAPGRTHLHASYDAAWYQDGHPFTPAHSARLGAVTAVHSWVFNGTAQRHGPAGEATRRHAEYLVELSKAWAHDPARPVWLQEVGAPAPHVPPEQAAAFTEATVEHALDCPDLWGVTWWCSHDVDRALADFPELEYGLGLLTNDRRTKPAGEAFARAARERRGGTRRPQPRSTALVVDAGDADTAPARSVCAPGGAYFEAWMRLAADGARPACVLAQQDQDAGHLAARGITETVTVDQVG